MMSEPDEWERTLLPEQPPTPVAARRYSGRALIVSLAAGFVAAAVICVALAAGGALPGQQKDSGGGASKAGIALPKRFLSYARTVDAVADRSPSAQKDAAARQADFRNTARALSAAHHGAGAAAEGYASADLQTMFTVWAVRDATPPPVVPVVDPDRLGLAVAPEVVRAFGDVACDIRYLSVTKGNPVTPEAAHTVLCQRSSSSLTVTVLGPGGDVGNHPEQVVAMVNAVWAELT